MDRSNLGFEVRNESVIVLYYLIALTLTLTLTSDAHERVHNSLSET